MKFFQTAEGRVHTSRIAGVALLVCLVPACIHIVEPLCLTRIIFTVGYWLLCCRKEPASRMLGRLDPIRVIGIVLILLGTIGQFYVIWQNWIPAR